MVVAGRGRPRIQGGHGVVGVLAALLLAGCGRGGPAPGQQGPTPGVRIAEQACIVALGVTIDGTKGPRWG